MLCFNTLWAQLTGDDPSSVWSYGKISRSVDDGSGDNDVDPCGWSQLVPRKRWIMRRCAFLSLMTDNSLQSTEGNAVAWKHCFPALSLNNIGIRCFLPQPLLWAQIKPWSFDRSFFSGSSCARKHGKDAYWAVKISTERDKSILTVEKELVPFALSPQLLGLIVRPVLAVSLKSEALEWAPELKKYICALNPMANGFPCLLSS